MTTLRQLPYATRHPVLAGCAAGGALALVLPLVHGLHLFGITTTAWMLVAWSLLAWRRLLAFRVASAFFAVLAVDILRGLPLTHALASTGIAVAVAGLVPAPGPTARALGPEHLAFAAIVAPGWWLAQSIAAWLLPRLEPMNAWALLHVIVLMSVVAVGRFVAYVLLGDPQQRQTIARSRTT